MKNRRICLIFIIIIIFPYCTYRDKNEETDKKSEADYSSKMTERNKQLVQQFFDGQLIIHEGFYEINGGFYCLWKQRDVLIKPHHALNRLFKKNGYKITLSRDSLKYIIVSETKSNRVGQYSNGAQAVTIETIISVIDLENGIAFKLADHNGGPPPSSTRSRSVDIGSHWDDEDIFYNIRNKITK
jgi:hypothetical protein